MLFKMAIVKYAVCLLLQMCTAASETSLQQATFHLLNGTSFGMPLLQAPGTATSRELCALKCVSWESKCFSFTYNSESGLCVLGTQVSRNHPAIPPEQGDLYIKNGCNSIGGFVLWEDQFASLYVFVSGDGDSLNFADAQKSCADMCAYLVRLSDFPKYDLFQSMVDMENDLFWVGMDDREVDGRYVWSNDGSPVDDFNTLRAYMFRAGQPDNFGGTDDCIGYINGLFDSYCDYKMRYVCQRSP